MDDAPGLGEKTNHSTRNHKKEDARGDHPHYDSDRPATSSALTNRMTNATCGQPAKCCTHSRGRTESHGAT